MKAMWHEKLKMYSFDAQHFEIDGTKFELTGARELDGYTVDDVRNVSTGKTSQIKRNRLGDIIVEENRRVAQLERDQAEKMNTKLMDGM